MVWWKQLYFKFIHSLFLSLFFLFKVFYKTLSVLSFFGGHLHFLFKAMLNSIWKCHYLEPCFFWQEDIPIFQALCKTKRVKLEEECKKWYRGELNNEICHFFFLILKIDKNEREPLLRLNTVSTCFAFFDFCPVPYFLLNCHLFY